MRSIYTFFLLICTVSAASATHFKGGEIIASHVSGQTYKIKIRLYIDKTTAAGQAVTEQQVCFGDGATETWKLATSTDLPGTNITLQDFEGNHTYSAAGTFQISAQIDNRTSGIINLENSQLVPAFLWTVVNTQVTNNTPVTTPLAFTAGAKQLFSIDLKPTVADADSITSRVARLSKASPGTCGVRMTDHNYLYPNDITRNGTFRVESQKLVWNAPERTGTYVFAVIVDEWRNGVKISESYREGLIEVIDKPGETVQSPPYESAENGGVITSIPKVESSEVSMAIEAYPVPTQDFVTVKAYSKTRAVISLQLIDLKGRVVQQLSSKTAVISIQERFDMRQLASGIYIIRADNAKDSVSQKVVR